ncbi:tripartite tricarboxylate transporter substrate binding protein [Rhodoferax sp.]|uniref:Bug family tripartite tricarboxylate transporter substrate binding protein n=1 Tax=Rhodoferax sp. TaxID=50421 RepID=UPI002733BE6E|nr:tripartite tricarboxylate transporter substrate binding protein [Rhodoferax sp.]
MPTIDTMTINDHKETTLNNPMSLNRRAFARLALTSAGACLAAPALYAQSSNKGLIRVVVPFASGGGTDVIGRSLVQAMAEELGQTMIIDNKPGAGTVIGSDFVAKAAPDGQTLLMTTSAVAINASLMPRLPYDTLADLPPVGRICHGPNVIVVRVDSKIQTLADLIKAAKADPGKLSYASSGNGSSVHLTAEFFKAKAGIRLLHIPYRGAGPAYTDLLGGQVDLLVGTAGGTHKFVQSGKMRALAVTSAARSSAYPGVPTVAESLPGFEANVWYGLFASKGTPAATIDRLNAALRKAAGSNNYKEAMEKEGLTVSVNSPTEMQAFMAQEVETWRKVVTTAGIKPD